jgi:hypothetical protein
MQLPRGMASGKQPGQESNALAQGRSPQRMLPGDTACEAHWLAEMDLAEAYGSARSRHGAVSGRWNNTCWHRHPEKRRTEAAMAYSPKA